jgi:hypothetical protein
MTESRVFGIGLGAIAFAIGLLTGMSSSPVVASLIPLLFTLITAGGIAAAVKGGSSLPFKSPKDYGLGLIVFALAFLLGLYAGVFSKLHAGSIWFREATSKPAYQNLNYSDFRLLAVALKLDNEMIASGLPPESRQAVFDQLQLAMAKRAQQRQAIADRSLMAAGLKEDERVAALLGQVNTIRTKVEDAYSNSDDFTHDDYIAITEEIDLLAAETNLDLLSELASAEWATAPEGGAAELLHSDELEAITPILELDFSKLKVSNIGRVIASDSEGFVNPPS